jgi:hypothetical protein
MMQMKMEKKMQLLWKHITFKKMSELEEEIHM